MHLLRFFGTESRQRNLDRLWLVLLLTVVPMGIGLYYAWKAKFNYYDPLFSERVFKGELRSSLYLLLITVVFFPPIRIGLRWPGTFVWRQTWPLVVWLGVTAACWLAFRASMPAGAAIDNTISLSTLRTTTLAGINEEWLFRGLLTAALCRRYGLRQGSLVGLALFGAFHAGNTLLGEKIYAALFQVVSATLLGAMLLLATLGTRSLLVPMLAHGLYDFMVMDINHLMRAGGDRWLAIPIALVSLVLGGYCLLRVRKLEPDATYLANDEASQISAQARAGLGPGDHSEP